MKPKINALVVGTGSFGKYYAQILSRLNSEDRLNLPFVDKLIITKTDLNRARDFADTLRDTGDCSANEVIAAEVFSLQHLIALLEKYTPRFIGIAALDKDVGDTIHAIYTTHALNYGAVLCEKPFSNAIGDGSSLEYFEDIFKSDNAELFGLELPMAVIMREIMRYRDFVSLVTHAKHFEFHWETLVSSGGDIINDLALHPWSFIPRNYEIRSSDVEDRKSEAYIDLHLYNEMTRLPATCKMTLKTGGTFRGLSIDDYTIVMRSEGTTLKLIELDIPLEEAAMRGGQGCSGPVLLTVENPLKQNIVAVLQKSPIVKLKRAYASQLFLEMLHGYTPNESSHLI